MRYVVAVMPDMDSATSGGDGPCRGAPVGRRRDDGAADVFSAWHGASHVRANSAR